MYNNLILDKHSDEEVMTWDNCSVSCKNCIDEVMKCNNRGILEQLSLETKNKAEEITCILERDIRLFGLFEKLRLQAEIRAKLIRYVLTVGYKFGLSYSVSFLRNDKLARDYVLEQLRGRFGISARKLRFAVESACLELAEQDDSLFDCDDSIVSKKKDLHFKYSQLAKLGVINFDYENSSVSIKDDSYFKCIIGYYRSKYRRILIINDVSFINASCVCGGCN